MEGSAFIFMVSKINEVKSIIYKVININEEKEWDLIVKSFSDYDVTYLYNYAKAFYYEGEGEPFLFYFNDGSTRAINVVLKRDIARLEFFNNKIPENTYFDLSSPYGYGGFIIDGENHEIVNKVYDNYCREEGFVSEFVRFHLVNGYQFKYNGCIETNSRNIIRDLALPLDDMFMDFEHKVRKSIKKARKANLEIEIDTEGNNIEEFLNIYYETMKRNNAEESYYYPKSFFENINKLNGNFVYFHVWYQNEIISSELVIHGSENCYSFLGGTNKEYFHLSPNNFLKYEIIKWAKENGLKRFIFGGGKEADDGIYKYKRSFAPNGVYDFYIGKKIFNEEKYKKLVSMKSEEEDFNLESLFFPLYRG